MGWRVWDVKLHRSGSLSDNQFFLVGVLIGSVFGLVLGSALGFELRPDNLRALRKLVRRLAGRDVNPHYDVMV